ncbi:hypothetical protein N8Z07_03345 [Pelagibacteraceae bacterium]|jgi:type IV pilus assembly protein PilQ|nr:hypothetical protein [Pelagibacteraceae bacterium]
MKKILITISFLLFISGCASYIEAEKKAANDKKLKKEKIALEKIEKENELKKIDVKKFKKENQIIADNTKEEGPSIGFSNKKKPRRALTSNANVNNKGLSSPNTSVSINFSNINLPDGLTALGRLVGRNIISSSKVQGYLNLQIQNQPWNDVFNSILEMHKLSFIGSKKDSIIRVYTEDEGMTTSGSGGLETEVFNIFYEKPSEILTQLTPIFPETGEGEDKVAAAIFIANDVNKTLAVQGTSFQVTRIENLLNTLDVKKAQILIEAFIVEASPKFEQKLGTRLGIANNRTSGDSDESKIIRGVAGTQVTPTTDTLTVGTDENSATNFLIGGTSGLGIIAKTSTQQLKFEIDAMEEEGDTKTLSNPKIFTTSGKNAKITQGTELGVTVTKVVDGVNVTETEFVNVSLELDVTPTITGDGTVELVLKIANDSLVQKTAPVEISKKTIDTSLVLSDGEIAVIGGILTRTQALKNKRVPLLGEIPIIGWMFRNKTESDTKTELLIFIAPRIV